MVLVCLLVPSDVLWLPRNQQNRRRIQSRPFRGNSFSIPAEAHPVKCLVRKATGNNMPSKYLANLNKQQRRAVRHGLNSKKPDFRPLLVIAGAGTGKTELITHRVAHLILKGTSPHRILLLAFGRLAAGKMTGRAKNIVASVNGINVDLPWSGTFHSIGARLLRQFARQVGRRPTFTILDPSDAESLMNTVRSDLGFAKKPRGFPDKTVCLKIYSYMVNSQKLLKQR